LGKSLKLTVKIRYTEKNLWNWLWQSGIFEKMNPFKILATPLHINVLRIFLVMLQVYIRVSVWAFQYWLVHPVVHSNLNVSLAACQIWYIAMTMEPVMEANKRKLRGMRGYLFWKYHCCVQSAGSICLISQAILWRLLDFFHCQLLL
jgi:hypothetical protein